MQKKETDRTRILSFEHRALAPYVTAIGQLTLVWNSLHLDLSILFTSISGGAFRDQQILAIWHSVSSDRQQRDMLIAAVKSEACEASQMFPKLPGEVEWLCGQASRLEEIRNNALHSPIMGFRYNKSTKVIPVASMGHKRAEKLLGKDLLNEFSYCRDAALILGDYAIDLSGKTASLEAWPERPKLPNRGETNDKKLLRQGKQVKHLPQP